MRFRTPSKCKRGNIFKTLIIFKKSKVTRESTEASFFSFPLFHPSSPISGESTFNKAPNRGRSPMIKSNKQNYLGKR